MVSRTRMLSVVLVLVLAAVSAAAPPAFAAKRGGGGGSGGTTTGSSSLALVLLNSTDGLPHWGQQITFTVSTTATTEPHVSVTCSQNGALVYSASAGFFASYPWPWTQIMTLSSQSWTGGAADCTATLYAINGTKVTNLAALAFHVYA